MLSWISLGLLLSGAGLRIAFPEEADGGVLDTVVHRIVSRTVSYGLLSSGLIGLYLAAAAVLRPLLEPVTGSSSLAVAASTLAVAAAFNPARRRLQAAVDRRFDRARYDAAFAVIAFATRLRDQVDIDQVTAGLRDTVAATVAPTRVGVRLTVPARQGGG
jgi:hypothetical protein